MREMACSATVAISNPRQVCSGTVILNRSFTYEDNDEAKELRK